MLFMVASCLLTVKLLNVRELNSFLNEEMKKLNEWRFLHGKLQNWDYDFHSSIFPCCTRKSPLLLIVHPLLLEIIYLSAIWSLETWDYDQILSYLLQFLRVSRIHIFTEYSSWPLVKLEKRHTTNICLFVCLIYLMSMW